MFSSVLSYFWGNPESTQLPEKSCQNSIGSDVEFIDDSTPEFPKVEETIAEEPDWILVKEVDPKGLKKANVPEPEDIIINGPPYHVHSSKPSYYQTVPDSPGRKDCESTVISIPPSVPNNGSAEDSSSRKPQLPAYRNAPWLRREPPEGIIRFRTFEEYEQYVLEERNRRETKYLPTSPVVEEPPVALPDRPVTRRKSKSRSARPNSYMCLQIPSHPKSIEAQHMVESKERKKYYKKKHFNKNAEVLKMMHANNTTKRRQRYFPQNKSGACNNRSHL